MELMLLELAAAVLISTALTCYYKGTQTPGYVTVAVAATYSTVTFSLALLMTDIWNVVTESQ